ncbi:MAG: hypothetical protein P8N19_13010 [Flavobacteriales bacterium]|nr:hypothetical protein [Flavobacteriales bacterium]MDG1766358.1 hypothetical protein [Flavobacteriales bacterium]
MNILVHLATFCFLVSGLDVKAQDPLDADDGESEVCVYGVIKSGNKKCDEALVLVYDGNELVTSHVTDKDGKFKVYIDFQNNYTIQVLMNGMLSKTVSFDTHSAIDRSAFSFQCDFHLTPKQLFGQQDLDILDFPVAFLVYSDEEKSFIMNESYTGNYRKNFQSLLQETQIELAQE